jgi:hypothetical protein
VVDLRRLGASVARIAAEDPPAAADLLEAIAAELPAADHAPLACEVAEAIDRFAAADSDRDDAPAAPGRGTAPDAPASSRGSRALSLALDVTQVALSIAGIFDPTPTCDALDGLISLLRGDYAGAAISAVSMIPYLGDAAKLGKLPKLGKVIDEALQLAKVDTRFAASVAPDLNKIGDDLRAALKRGVAAPLAAFAQSVLRRLDDAPAAGDGAASLRKGAMSGGRRIETSSLPAERVEELTRQVEDTMKALGIPDEYIGIPEYGGRAFDPLGTTAGGNIRGRGINVDAGVLAPMEGWDAWNGAPLGVRIEAVIAHEWEEFRGATHAEALRSAPSTSLAISREARELLEDMLRLFGRAH